MTQTTPKKAAKPKRTRKVATPSKAVKKAAEPKVNAHIAAGVKVDRYSGPSKFVNANRKPKILLGREVANLTDRSQGGLYALRDAYGDKAFKPRGFDNGVLRDLLAKGLISVSGGQETVIDGSKYIVDGDKPVVLKITAAGLNYGKA